MHSIHSSWTSNRMLATYVPSMRKSNLKIRIAAVLIARNNHWNLFANNIHLLRVKTFYHISRLYLHFPGMENYWANFKSFSRIQDSLRTLELSDCVLCIPFIRRGRPIECWLHTYQACAKATWRLGLRLFWSHAITIKIYLQIIFIFLRIKNCP